MQNKYPLVFIFCFFSIFFYAQENNVVNVLPEYNEMEVISLPTLDSCIQAALENSPLLKVSDVQVEKLLEELKIQKKSWLTYVHIDANARYGLFNTLQIEQTNPDIPGVGVQTAREQFNYFAGITVKIPLSNFVNGKSEQKIIQRSIKEAELRRDELKLEITKIVINEYFKLKSVQERLAIHQNNLQSTRLDYVKALNDIKNNFLSMTEFASISTSYTKANEAFIASKNEFYTQYHLLRLLIGINHIQSSTK